jgi:hypothetical protein
MNTEDQKTGGEEKTKLKRGKTENPKGINRNEKVQSIQSNQTLTQALFGLRFVAKTFQNQRFFPISPVPRFFTSLGLMVVLSTHR